MDDSELAELATEAYVWGYPVVFNHSQLDRYLTHGLGRIRSSLNEFGHADELAAAGDEFVSVNNDTLYSIAPLDLSGGPIRLDVPATGDRYFVFQMIDAWTNNFAYVGTRATGTEGGSFWLTPPGWSDEVPEGCRQIEVPTTIALIAGRWACAGAADVPAVGALRSQVRITPSGAAGELPPATTDGDLAFWETLRTLVAAFPPGPDEQAVLDRFAPLGLADSGSPLAAADPAVVEALRAGNAAGQQRVEELSTAGSTTASGWVLDPHLFDYNLDHLSLGALDSPEWKVADRHASHALRAVAARVGLWGNHGYEAVYPFVFVDEQGDRLDGSQRYRLHLPSPLPAKAFWSLTMYDLPDYYLVANPIGRYSIGDRTPGIRWAADGSLTICIQHDEPTDPIERANWLPAPAGAFRPMMRIYIPGDEILDGSFELPPIERLG